MLLKKRMAAYASGAQAGPWIDQDWESMVIHISGSIQVAQIYNIALFFWQMS